MDEDKFVMAWNKNGFYLLNNKKILSQKWLWDNVQASYVIRSTL